METAIRFGELGENEFFRENSRECEEISVNN